MRKFINKTSVYKENTFMGTFFKKLASLFCAALFMALSLIPLSAAYAEEPEKNFIRWVDNKVPYEILMSAYEYEVKYHDSDTVDFDFAKALAYLATRNGNKFSVKKDLKALSDLVLSLQQGKKIDDYFGNNRYYKDYVEAYDAIFCSS